MIRGGRGDAPGGITRSVPPAGRRRVPGGSDRHAIADGWQWHPGSRSALPRRVALASRRCGRGGDGPIGGRRPPWRTAGDRASPATAARVRARPAPPAFAPAGRQCRPAGARMECDFSPVPPAAVRACRPPAVTSAHEHQTTRVAGAGAERAPASGAEAPGRTGCELTEQRSDVTRSGASGRWRSLLPQPPELKKDRTVRLHHPPARPPDCPCRCIETLRLLGCHWLRQCNGDGTSGSRRERSSHVARTGRASATRKGKVLLGPPPVPPARPATRGQE